MHLTRKPECPWPRTRDRQRGNKAACHGREPGVKAGVKAGHSGTIATGLHLRCGRSLDLDREPGDRAPPASGALQHRRDRPAVRMRIAPFPADGQVGGAGDVQPVAPELHAGHDADAVEAARPSNFKAPGVFPPCARGKKCLNAFRNGGPGQGADSGAFVAATCEPGNPRRGRRRSGFAQSLASQFPRRSTLCPPPGIFLPFAAGSLEGVVPQETGCRAAKPGMRPETIVP